jgi:hypothetical protein
MPFHYLAKTLAVYLAFCATPPAAPQPSSTARLTWDEFEVGLFQWIGHHPDVFPRGAVVSAHFPVLDLYAPTGLSIYHGDDSAKNAAFIQGLPKSIAGSSVNTLRPTLKEAIEMIPSFRAQKQTLLASKQYTAFVITYPDWDRCKAQNDAIAELRKHSQEIGVRILEVSLRP